MSGDRPTVGLRFQTRQGYVYEVTAVGRWMFLAAHADHPGVEFVFAIEDWCAGRMTGLAGNKEEVTT